MMKKIIRTLKDNLLILVGLTLGLDVLLDALDIQPPIMLVMIWLGLLITLLVWGGIEFAKNNKRNH